MLGFLFRLLLLYATWRLIRRFVLKSPLDNIPGPRPTSILTGSLSKIFTVNSWGFHKAISEKYGAIIKLKGLLGDNVLYVYDPLALSHILVKDAESYEITPAFLEGSRLMFGRGLAGTLGEEHRKQRRLLNPVFSPKNLREMVPQMYKTARKLEVAFSKRVVDGAQEIEVQSWFARIALELLAQCGLGVSFDPLSDDKPPHPYATAIKRVLPASGRMWFPRQYLLSKLVKIGTPRFRRWLVDITPSKNLHIMRDVIDMAHKTSTEIYESKKEAFQQGGDAIKQHTGQGKDAISILVQANMQASKDDKLSEDEIIAQVSTLSFTGTDTTSSALARLIWVLCEYPEVQERLRAELSENLPGEDGLTFEVLDTLPYLEAVVKETLRLFTPPTLQQRVCRKELVLPFYTPIRGNDGTLLREVVVPKDTTIIMSILSSNRNKAIWGEDAYEFKPDRWLKPLPESVINAKYPGIYSNLMTFLAGPRSCIGVKFTQLEMKVILSLLVPKFKFALPPGVEIFWNNGTLALPIVVGGPPGPKLPVIVESVENRNH